MENLQKKIEDLINIYKLKRYSEAEIICGKLIESNPKIAFLYNLMGVILSDQNKQNEAINIYRKGIKIDQKFALLHNNLGNSYKAQNNFIEAEKSYRKAIEIDSKISEPYNNLANLLRANNNYQEAIKLYEKAISNNKSFFWAYYNMGTTLTALGNYEEAKNYFETTIKINPQFCPAHRSLSRVKKYKSNDKHLDEMQNIFQNKNIDDNNKKEIAFALGKAYEDIGDFTSSFNYYRVGNKLERDKIKFSIKDEEKEFQKIKNVYNLQLLKNIKKIPNEKIKTIFIIGMPRSGTTLVEQIIASHPKVFGCDELNFIPDLVKKYKDISSLSSESLSNIGNEYLEKISKVSKNKQVVTDKLPINFKWLGFIKLIMPNSIIIHCSRNPKDNCFSIFKSYFSSRINFACDLNEIVNFYNLYLNLMDYWNKVMPNSIYNIKYEKLIEDPSNEIKKLIKACNLTWNDNCLEFHKNKRAIKTASDTQVRNKMYKTSVNSWKNYDKHLNDYFNILNI